MEWNLSQQRHTTSFPENTERRVRHIASSITPATLTLALAPMDLYIILPGVAHSKIVHHIPQTLARNHGLLRLAYHRPRKTDGV